MMRTTVSNTCRRVGVAPLTVALLTALLMMALAACGSDGAPSADQGDAHPEGEPAAMIEPSQLISQDEAESIIGHTLDVVEDTERARQPRREVEAHWCHRVVTTEVVCREGVVPDGARP